jgi:hypothetical protein
MKAHKLILIVLCLLIAGNTLARVIAPFLGWQQLADSSTDIAIVHTLQQTDLNSNVIKGSVLLLTGTRRVVKPVSCPGNCGLSIPA